jgi:hypothetical protein
MKYELCSNNSLNRSTINWRRRSQGIQAVPHTFNYKYTVQEKGDLEIALIYKCKVFKTLLEIDNLLVEFKILLD